MNPSINTSWTDIEEAMKRWLWSRSHPWWRTQLHMFWLCPQKWHDFLRPGAWVSQTTMFLCLLPNQHRWKFPPSAPRSHTVWKHQHANPSISKTCTGRSVLPCSHPGASAPSGISQLVSKRKWWQVSWQVQKNPHACAVHWSIMETDLWRLVGNLHLAVTWGLLTLEPLGKAREFAQLIESPSCHLPTAHGCVSRM